MIKTNALPEKACIPCKKLIKKRPVKTMKKRIESKNNPDTNKRQSGLASLRMLKKSGLLLLLPVLFFGCLFAYGCAGSDPFTITDINMEQLGSMMDEKQTFTLLVERDQCEFCQELNSYLEQTQDEHPGLQIYRLNTTDFELYREQEGDMTLISETEQGKAFLERFPYFLYTPAVYKIDQGVPVNGGFGYDAVRHTVSQWSPDSTIDWNASKPVDVWEFLSSTPQPSE